MHTVLFFGGAGAQIKKRGGMTTQQTLEILRQYRLQTDDTAIRDAISNVIASVEQAKRTPTTSNGTRSGDDTVGEAAPTCKQELESRHTDVKAKDGEIDALKQQLKREQQKIANFEQVREAPPG